jgi:enamine deaminase RidA (YjgF/YER057c/UK114 family)
MIGERISSGSIWEEKVGYSRAVVVDDWIFLSGTTGFDPVTNAYPATAEAQCENAFRNIAAALAKAGSGLDDLVRVVIYIRDEEDFPRLIPIIRKHCANARPANTTIFARLVTPEMKVEIEATARRSKK